MKQAYIQRRFNPPTARLIDQANEIIEEYQADGYTLTLRQLYYQFVSRDLIANKQSEYDRLGNIINKARLAGLIDWSAIEDRTRNLSRLSNWESPADIVRSCSHWYMEDIWASQETYCEVWVEKEALVGVIEPVCEKLRVPFFACRGYTSQSEAWRAGQRLIDEINSGKEVTIFHLGDHDPSGIDMTRDNDDRLAMFIAPDADPGSITVKRLALNIDQVKKHRPPPNPVKFTDSRVGNYVALHGNSSWELDALDPKIIGELIRDNVQDIIDQDAWDIALLHESQNKTVLINMAKKMEKR